jgi:hypothetical protein
MQLKVVSSLLIAALLLVGCDRGISDRPAPMPAKTESAPADSGPPPKGLSAAPDSVRNCDVKAGVATLLRWDVTDSGAQRVVLTVQNPKRGEEKRFGRGGPVGSKQTGPWLRPGLIFRLRDQATNAELGSVIINGVPCD